MKRKSLSSVQDYAAENQTKLELKRRKMNAANENIPNTASPSIKKLEAQDPQNAAIESSIDRFLSSLLKQDRVAHSGSKGKVAENDSSPIVKNLSSTYRNMGDTNVKREPFQELTELKYVRTLAKLNKIDDNPNPDQDFNEKISKKLEMISIAPVIAEAKSGSKKSESLKKALSLAGYSSNKEPIEDDQQSKGYLSIAPTDFTPESNKQDRASPDFFKVLVNEEDFQDKEENNENKDNGCLSLILGSPKRTKEEPNAQKGGNRLLNTIIQEETPTQSSNQVSAKQRSKRRESFSIKDASSKSKAFQVFSNSLKNSAESNAGSKRASTCPKITSRPDGKRKSVNMPVVTLEVPKTKPSRKSMTPDNVGSNIDTIDENKQLKKDLKRKNKEIENLKREKLALIRKLKAIDPSLVDEGNQSSIESTKIYCRVKPGLLEKVTSVISYPEMVYFVNSNKDKIPILKCIELNSNTTKKADFYFDRVFPQSTAQIEVFEELLPFIQNAAQGNSNLCIASYGPSSSGKSYTIQGINIPQASKISSGSGLMPRTAEIILSRLEVGKIQSSFVILEFGCIMVMGDKIIDMLSCLQTDEAPNVLNINDLEGNDSLGDKTNQGVFKALNWKHIDELQTLLSLLDEISKINTSHNFTQRQEHSCIISFFKITHASGHKNLIQFAELSFANQATQSPHKVRSRPVSAFLENLQKISPETKEILFFFNLNLEEENYSQTKELLESSLQLANSGKGDLTFL